MSNIRVNVEGAPEAVAKFFKEMGRTQFIENHVAEDTASLSRIEGMKTTVNVDAEAVCNKITEKVSQDSESKNEGPKEEKKTRKPRQKKEDKVEVTAEAPDSEFEGVPSEEPKGEDKAPAVTLPMVKEALKEYGIWIVEQGHESSSAKNVFNLSSPSGRGLEYQVFNTGKLYFTHIQSVLVLRNNTTPQRSIRPIARLRLTRRSP